MSKCKDKIFKNLVTVNAATQNLKERADIIDGEEAGISHQVAFMSNLLEKAEYLIDACDDDEINEVREAVNTARQNFHRESCNRLEFIRSSRMKEQQQVHRLDVRIARDNENVQPNIPQTRPVGQTTQDETKVTKAERNTGLIAMSIIGAVLVILGVLALGTEVLMSIPNVVKCIVMVATGIALVYVAINKRAVDWLPPFWIGILSLGVALIIVGITLGGSALELYGHEVLIILSVVTVIAFAWVSQYLHSQWLLSFVLVGAYAPMLVSAVGASVNDGGYAESVWLMIYNIIILTVFNVLSHKNNWIVAKYMSSIGGLIGTVALSSCMVGIVRTWSLAASLAIIALVPTQLDVESLNKHTISICGVAQAVNWIALIIMSKIDIVALHASEVITREVGSTWNSVKYVGTTSVITDSIIVLSTALLYIFAARQLSSGERLRDIVSNKVSTKGKTFGEAVAEQQLVMAAKAEAEANDTIEVAGSKKVVRILINTITSTVSVGALLWIAYVGLEVVRLHEIIPSELIITLGWIVLTSLIVKGHKSVLGPATLIGLASMASVLYRVFRVPFELSELAAGSLNSYHLDKILEPSTIHSVLMAVSMALMFIFVTYGDKLLNKVKMGAGAAKLDEKDVWQKHRTISNVLYTVSRIASYSSLLTCVSIVYFLVTAPVLRQGFLDPRVNEGGKFLGPKVEQLALLEPEYLVIMAGALVVIALMPFIWATIYQRVKNEKLEEYKEKGIVPVLGFVSDIILYICNWGFITGTLIGLQIEAPYKPESKVLMCIILTLLVTVSIASFGYSLRVWEQLFNEKGQLAYNLILYVGCLLTWMFTVLVGTGTPAEISCLIEMIAAVGMIWNGFKTRYKAERIIGLILAISVSAIVTLIGIYNSNTIETIISLIGCGALLLWVSWLYNKTSKDEKARINEAATSGIQDNGDATDVAE